jgi:hypothetical protein
VARKALSRGMSLGLIQDITGLEKKKKKNIQA